MGTRLTTNSKWCATLALTLLMGACSRPAAEKPAFRIYVTNETSGDLSIIDSATLNVIANVPLGKRPRGIHASPDGKTIYVALSGSPIGGPGVDESKLPPPDKSADGIGVFDVAQGKIVRVIKCGSDPEEFDLSLDGKTLYISNEDSAGLTILDLATEKVVTSIPTGEEPEGVKLSPDGKHVLVTSEDEGTVAVVDTATQKKLHTIKVGRRPRTTAFMPDNTHFWVNAENDGTISLVDMLKPAVIDTISLGAAGAVKPMGVRLSKDATKLYVTTGRGKKVFVVNTATKQIEGSVEVGTRPWGSALSPDGRTLYTANGPSNDLSVVDLATLTVTRRVSLTGSPWGVITLQP